MTWGLLAQAWKAKGSPRDIGLSMPLIDDLRQILAPMNCWPLDPDTFQAPFFRIHVLDRADA